MRISRAAAAGRSDPNENFPMTDHTQSQQASAPPSLTMTTFEAGEHRAELERDQALKDRIDAREISHIGPDQMLGAAYLKDLWASRQLLFVLIGRDLRVRYKQTIFGGGWVVMQPLMTVAAYSLIFGLIAKMPSEGVPYPIFLLSALLPWIFFQRLVLESAASVSSNSNLVGKIYFPRLILPLATLGSLTVDLLVGFMVALVAMVLFGYFPGPQIVFLPLIVLFAGCAGLSVGMILAPIDVNYRDVRMVVPILLQILMFCSPIFYSATVVPEKYRWLFEANPIAVIATGVRWTLLNHGGPPSLVPTLISVGMVAVAFGIGLWLFVRAEALFADRI
jgi:lipopolysaccharide transport system permease protein